MIHFDPSEISNWADKPDAPHKLPELVRRLISATIPTPVSLAMPSGSSVRMPGWDGLLDVGCGNAWTPKGKSAWEFSCETSPKQKADRDFAKRTENPQGVNPSQTTFVFVTPRRWSGQSTWAETCRHDTHWSDVRSLDADDLSAWLDEAPAVAGWFARLIGKLPDTGFIPLDEWWERWSSATQPEIIPDLVLAGRREQADALGEWAMGKAGSWYIQADTRDEAIAFLSADAHVPDSNWGPTLLTKALVVQTDDAWMSLERHPYPLVLIRGFNSSVSPKLAVGKGHHVLTPLDRSQDPRGNGQTLPRLGRDETIRSLTEMGLTETDARSLIQKTARRLPILYCSLAEEAGLPGPEWATTASDSLIALVLLGQWEENNEGDRGIIERLAGKPFAEIENETLL